MNEKIDVIGAGAFGTALAIALAKGGRTVTLWGRNKYKMDDMRKNRVNHAYLNGATLPQNITLCDNLDNLCAKTALIALPMQKLRPFLQQHAPILKAQTIVGLSKGIDLSTGHLTYEIISSLSSAMVALLSGPSFANDISKGQPTAVVLACDASYNAKTLQQALFCPTLRIYLSHDLKGVALGGALKNVIAIAAGITIGAGLGQSARAALITRGFIEMQRIAVAMGAKPETLTGLSGFGDLILSCTSPQSRNYCYGLALGEGRPPRDQTTEGIATAKAMAKKAYELHIDAPLIKLVSCILNNKITLQDAIAKLQARPLRME